MFLAAELVNQGFPGCQAFLGRLEVEIPSRVAREYLQRLRRRDSIIQAMPLLARFRDDPELVRQMYRGQGFLFRPGTHRRKTAVVVFTTMYNNFYVSNLVFDALLAELGVSRLFLSDISEFSYFKGVKGLAGSLHELPRALERLLREQDIEDVILAGYSSGGYPALFVASVLGNVTCLGFSTFTDLSPGSTLPRRQMYEKLRTRIDPSLFRDMAVEIAPERGNSYHLYYGKRHADDMVHAEHLRGLAGVEVTCCKKAAHDLPGYMLEDGRLVDCFARHLRPERAS